MHAKVVVLGLLTTIGIPLAAQQPDSLPSGVTPQMIDLGKMLFEGPGQCTSCHGPAGKGIANAGPDLTDTTWVHGGGTFEGILALIAAGVPAEQSQSGHRMPERGASRLTEKQLQAVAAYVWSLSRTRP
jgi:mono/diheme cytochrome c family protein